MVSHRISARHQEATATPSDRSTRWGSSPATDRHRERSRASTGGAVWWAGETGEIGILGQLARTLGELGGEFGGSCGQAQQACLRDASGAECLVHAITGVADDVEIALIVEKAAPRRRSRLSSRIPMTTLACASSTSRPTAGGAPCVRLLQPIGTMTRPSSRRCNRARVGEMKANAELNPVILRFAIEKRPCSERHS